MLKHPGRRVAEYYHSLVVLPRLVQGGLEPAPLLGGVMVVVVSGHHVALQVQGGVDPNQLQLPVRHVYPIIST